jgi:citrate lyase subunit beta/citryl-CoA lyase
VSDLEPLPRSYLYAPGSDRRLMEKALASEADSVVLDLEDAVVSARKNAARKLVAALLRASPTKPVLVRINAESSGLAEEDLAAVAGPWLVGIRLPKVETPEWIQVVADHLDRRHCTARIYPLIESALGVERAYAIACSHPRVASLGLGEADLSADLGVSDATGLLFARSRIVVAARAAGLPPPIQSVFPHVRDLEALRRSTEQGRSLGFFGRSVIHPAQIPIVHAVFTPSEDEVRQARELLEALAQAEATGAGAAALPDGRFVDRAVVEGARRTLSRAAAHEPPQLPF